MIAEDNVRNIETLEAFTLYSLDRSLEGLETLVRETRQCGEALQGGLKALPGELSRIKALAQQLHDFNVFELNLSCLFQLDRAQFSDDNGTFEAAMASFREALEDFKVCLAHNDLPSAGLVLNKGVGGSLKRIGALIPVVRDWINKEFGEPSEPVPETSVAEPHS